MFRVKNTVTLYVNTATVVLLLPTAATTTIFDLFNEPNLPMLPQVRSDSQEVDFWNFGVVFSLTLCSAAV